MKNLFLLLIVAVIAINFVVTEEVYSASDLAEWNNFKTTHGRSFSPEEDSRRLKIFVDNRNLINEHNAKFDAGEVSWKMGINQFSDRTPDELPRGLRT